MSWYVWGHVCHPEAPKQAGRMDQQEPYETQQRPTPTWSYDSMLMSNIKLQ